MISHFLHFLSSYTQHHPYHIKLKANKKEERRISIAFKAQRDDSGRGGMEERLGDKSHEQKENTARRPGSEKRGRRRILLAEDG